MNLLKWFQRKREENTPVREAPERIEPAKPVPSAREDALAKQMKQLSDFLADKVDSHIPPAGRGRPLYIQTRVEGAPNTALLVVQPGANDRAVTFGAMREGYDMQVMNILFSGDNEAVKAWLRRPETPGELADLFPHLSDRLDEKLDG